MMAGRGTALPLRGPLTGIAALSILLPIVLFSAPLLLGCNWLSLLASARRTLSLTAWTSLLASPQAGTALASSAMLGTLTAFGATLLAWPLAFLIVLRGRLLGRIVLGFVIVMWFLDPGLRILGWMQAFKESGVDRHPAGDAAWRVSPPN